MVLVVEYRKVDGAGRVRLPLRFRKELGIEHRDMLDIRLENGPRGEKVLVVRRVRREV